MPHNRIRTRDKTAPRVGAVYSPVTQAWSDVNSTQSDVEVCNDTVGNFGGDNVFLLTRFREYDRSMDGRTANGWAFRDIFLWDAAIPGHRIGDSLSSGQINAHALKAQGITNPNRPSVSIPTFIGELKDLPGLIRSFGLKHLKGVLQYGNWKAFPKEVAGKHLAWRWGIKPMISDLRKMMDFVGKAERRRQELKSLKANGTLNRSVKVDNSTDKEILNDQPLWSQGASVRGFRTTITKRRVWVSVKWKASDPASIPDPTPGFDEAWKSVMGFNAHGAVATAWELLPWSWLIDWFAGIGDLIAAKNNAIGVTPTSTCVMCETRTVSYFTLTYCTPGVAVSGDIGGYRVTKRRTPCATPSPINLSFLPLLEADKWSILGSLAIQRVKR